MYPVALRATDDEGTGLAQFNEDSRVKIPALLHLMRLGYTYLSLKDAKWDPRNNIFPEIFEQSILRLNPQISAQDIPTKLNEIQLALAGEDLGRAFHRLLTARSGFRLIDFDDPKNNSWHVVTELPFENGDDSFRPDVTLLINGMPLAFVEVKKRMNQGGVIQERERMDRRHKNAKFRHFFNLLQLMAFSNNMEYDDGQFEPIQGAFYAASTYGEAHFNYFREERASELIGEIGDIDDGDEDFVLKDTNLVSIKATPEFARNKNPDSPTNRLLTSLFSRGRLLFLLQYAFAWLDKDDGIQKHVMRYPQFFATLAIAEKLAAGVRKGIIWHTQGSGKTALAYYNVRFLTDWFQERQQVARFYFIVDRLDLLTQAEREFRSRGLVVNVINSREAFARDIKRSDAVTNARGEPEITVVNIQKFKDDPDVIPSADYALNLQRVYFLDEVHRSYNPKGSFLANLELSDRNAIKIGLTGTPLIGEQLQSKAVFGDYIHTYYYNASIADGYTLRLIREEIATRYKMQLEEALAKIEIRQGGIDRKMLYSHPRFATAMLDYIIDDFKESRITLGDLTIGGMVICDSAEQARELHKQFQEKRLRELSQTTTSANDSVREDRMVAEPRPDYNRDLTASLILHDEGDSHSRKEDVEAFKKGDIDLLFVYNMLLTGFDAPRLKKLYFGRVIKRHNLLQALTRVNRRYGNFRYGYVVDFADIQREFDDANRDYFNELNAELGDEMQHYSSIFKSESEIRDDIALIKEALFEYSLEDAEKFSQQISEIQDIDKVRAITAALAQARELHNLIRIGGFVELAQLLDFAKLRILHREAQHALASLNLKHQLEYGEDNSALLNEAIEDTIFQFVKLGESELKLADELRNTLQRARSNLQVNSDPQDPQFIQLREELERLYKAKKLSSTDQEEMKSNISSLLKIEKQARELNSFNANLAARYGGDTKLMRVHKRLIESRKFGNSQVTLHSALSGIKVEVDDSVLRNRDLLVNEPFFKRQVMPIVTRHFRNFAPEPDAETRSQVQRLLVNEYINEFHGYTAN